MNSFVSSGQRGGKRPFRGGKREPASPFSFDMFCMWCGQLIKNQAIMKRSMYIESVFEFCCHDSWGHFYCLQSTARIRMSDAGPRLPVILDSYELDALSNV